MIKRTFDIIFSLIVIFCCAPIFFMAALIIAMDTEGPIIFRQKRVGKNGKIFTILKFKTMEDAPGELVTASGDKRISRCGKILRRTNFDELPQFVNIFKGEMSVVGPRPEIPSIVADYSPEQKKILAFKPGFTSLATVKFLHEEKLLPKKNVVTFYKKNIIPGKIACDFDYFSYKSNLFRDIVIIFKTVGGTFNV